MNKTYYKLYSDQDVKEKDRKIKELYHELHKARKAQSVADCELAKYRMNHESNRTFKHSKRLFENVGGYEWLKDAFDDYDRRLLSRYLFGVLIIERINNAEGHKKEDA